MAKKTAEFFDRIRLAAEKFAKLFDGARLAVKKTLDDMSTRKRRLVLIVAGAVLLILLLIFILTKLSQKGSAVAAPVPPVSALPEARSAIIPPEDLFLPDEPDFIPGVMPEREQREKWSADDAAPWWYDPLRSGEQQWRDKIEKTVDIIMENVP
jgi:hypothetical protein